MQWHLLLQTWPEADQSTSIAHQMASECFSHGPLDLEQSLDVDRLDTIMGIP